MGAHYRNCRANGAKVTQPLEPKKERLPACAPEGQEQATLFNWADAQARMGIYPELALMFHIPNGGKRSKAEAGISDASRSRSIAVCSLSMPSVPDRLCVKQTHVPFPPSVSCQKLSIFFDSLNLHLPWQNAVLHPPVENINAGTP